MTETPRKDALYSVMITSPTGTLVSLNDADYDTAWAACKAVQESTKDEKLREMVNGCMRSFGFSGHSHGAYRVDISAYLPKITGEPQTCGRRMADYGWWEQKENLDTWDKIGDDLVCSFCGSLHPDRVIELIREHGWSIVERSTKSYKIYIRRQNVPNASFGGIKYYRYHDTQKFVDEWNALLEESKHDTIIICELSRHQEGDAD